jgi:hypothetical protein
MASLESYVLEVRDLMRLREWDIEIEVVDDLPAANADIRVVGIGWQSLEVKLHINKKEWDKFEGVERRQLVVHELLHLHLLPFCYLAARGHEGWDSEAVAEAMMIERLAPVIAAAMPMPPADDLSLDQGGNSTPLRAAA